MMQQREPSSKTITRVLVVDDSAVVREAMRLLLPRESGFLVETASDPIIASGRIAQNRPDVIVLDLEMPRMDGLTFLRQLMATSPIPVLICSGVDRVGNESAFVALEEGAVDIIAKPKLGVRDFLEETAADIRDRVRAASHARVAPLRRGVRSERGPAPLLPDRKHHPALRITTAKIVAVAASTGGTEALRQIVEALPPDAPAMLVVQHMPEGFTAAFAKRLDAMCGVEVKEAADGDRLAPGRVLIAPGNRHLVVERSGAHYDARIVDGPPVSRHRPSADVLFRSAARAAGANAIGVIMTGMGSDGAEGLLEMKRAGAATIAQDEASCVVFGMPKEAIARGAVEETVSLARIVPAILSKLGPR